MNIGVPTEIKADECRVAVTPAGVRELTRHGHHVIVQSGAGTGSGFGDEVYIAAGAECGTVDDVFATSELILKVKEPQPAEGRGYPTSTRCSPIYIWPPIPGSRTRCSAAGHAAWPTRPSRTGRDCRRRCGGRDGGARDDRGSLDRSSRAARRAVHRRVRTIHASEVAIEELLPSSDLVIGAVLVAGDRAPWLVRREHLASVRAGSVLVDISIDQGGCFETSEPTTHSAPTYEVDGIVHYCVANIPGAVPVTSTRALTNATLSYALHLANLGPEVALDADAGFGRGLNVAGGRIVHEAVAHAVDALALAA
jgi:alanine dehydrogenase